MTHVIRTNRLTKYFGRKCAVDQVSFAVPQGCVFALLGRNGSGKSTLMRMILGLLDPTRGSSTILGEDSQNISPQTRGRIGYVAEGHPLIGWMNVRQLESFQKQFYSTWNDQLFRSVIDHFGMDKKTKANHLSRGQRAGLSLALALAPEPELLVMDDPALGLDPVARRTLLEAMILTTRQAGRTIVFSSHILDDVERVADHVAIIDRSVLRVCATVENFLSSIEQFVLTFANEPPDLPNVPGLLQARREQNQWRLMIVDHDPHTQQLIKNLAPISVESIPISLEDAVLGYLADRNVKTSLLTETREEVPA